MQDQHIPAAVWLRVSTGEQEAGNQLPEIELFAAHHGYDLVTTYALEDESAWKENPGYKKALASAMQDAWRGRFKVLLIWSLDRLTRAGVEDALRLIRQFRERGVRVVSIQEPWLNGTDAVTDLLVAFAAWMAQQESKRKSERIKAGIARARAEGKQVGGRKPGARDRKPRRTEGYSAAWAKRRAAAA
jgi:putative DNA-invertase from lambdoid prophage Rac